MCSHIKKQQHSGCWRAERERKHTHMAWGLGVFSSDATFQFKVTWWRAYIYIYIIFIFFLVQGPEQFFTYIIHHTVHCAWIVFPNDADAGWDVYFTPNKARVISRSVVRVLSLFLSDPVSPSLSVCLCVKGLLCDYLCDLGVFLWRVSIKKNRTEFSLIQCKFSLP